MNSSLPRKLGMDEIARLIPQTNANVNKYSRGTVGVVGGSEAYPGAPVLAAMAAARSGAGYTRLVTVKGAAACARAHLLSIPVTGCVQSPDGTFCLESVGMVKTTLSKSRVILVGPGMGVSDETVAFLGEFFKDSELVDCPFVVDADALNVLADCPEILESRLGSTTVLTPHAGEAARLLGRPVADKVDDACTIADVFKSTVVLKGPQTIVASPQGQVFLMDEGGPELAKAGSGDVLGGMIAAFLSQGARACDAALLATHVHARAGKMAAGELSVHAVMPEDIIDRIGPALTSMEA